MTDCGRCGEQDCNDCWPSAFGAAANVRVEPSAETRTNAHAVRETFLALTYEGFTESQALNIVGQMLAAVIIVSAGEGGDTG